MATLPRDLIRSRIVTVSQDHFVLPGTVRENLDPFCAFETSDLIEALEAVKTEDELVVNA